MTSRAGLTAQKINETIFLNESERGIFFPSGLLGFSSCHQYQLERFKPGDGSDSPFFTLRAVDQDLSFPLIHPAAIALDFRFSVTTELLMALDARSADELIPLLIVTVRDRFDEITVNLQGPVIVNLNSSRGVQLVIEQYPLRHPLLNCAEA